MTLQPEVAERLHFLVGVADKETWHLTETAARLFDSAFTPERVESLAMNPDIAIEKRTSIQSFYQWKRLRNIRNAFVRDYPEHSAERAEALTLAAEGRASYSTCWIAWRTTRSNISASC